MSDDGAVAATSPPAFALLVRCGPFWATVAQAGLFALGGTLVGLALAAVTPLRLGDVFGSAPWAVLGWLAALQVAVAGFALSMLATGRSWLVAQEMARIQGADIEREKIAGAARDYGIVVQAVAVGTMTGLAMQAASLPFGRPWAIVVPAGLQVLVVLFALFSMLLPADE